MIKHKYPLEPDGPERIEVHWKRGLLRPGDGTRVLFDGRLVGTVDTRQELAEGKTFRLPDGSDLMVKWDRGPQVTLNDRSLSDALGVKQDIDNAGNFFAYMGIAWLFVSIGISLGIWNLASDAAFTVTMATGGILLIFLGFLSKRGQVLPLAGAILVWCALCIAAMTQAQALSSYITYGLLILLGLTQAYAALGADRTILAERASRAAKHEQFHD